MTAFPRVEQIVGYLTAKGWKITGHWRGADVWTRHEFDVLLPPGGGTADTASRMRDLIICVADAEERSPRSVAREMALPESDVVSYRVALPEFAAVSLGAGLRAVRAVRDLITTCARAAIDDVPGTDSRTPGRLVERTSVSTADEGFGLDLLIPVHHETAPHFGRATTTRLLRASNAALAADGPDAAGLDVFSALADLAGERRGSPFDLVFRWATALPTEWAETSLHFPRDFGADVSASRSKAVPAAARGIVQGRVTRLAHDGPRRVVTVRGALLLDGRPIGRERAVRVRVEDQQTYLAAVEAHAAELLVRVEGGAEITGAKYGIVVEPGGFTVVDGERG
ncbi:hypothetical protein [Lentzea flava]|uniref:Uncharacterized protein n=1 Tax=Lentzea flava TaxID=103732 RepID=A0ABQ2V912_9PSEU|nr:hypothetical protein [Lentzea flava]MCP2204031.1 hypothetical protein [Lentzea flava]GGU73855.1 hypothetical protein GCM10010178_76620 [Lentzea flava]